MRQSVVWFAIMIAGLLGCKPALQPVSVPASPISTVVVPAVSTPMVEPRALPTATPTSLPSPAAAKSGLKIVATVGPTCPGPQREGQICTSPFEGEFVVTRADGSEAARFKTDVDGHAQVDLAPGDYTVTATPGTGRANRRGGSATVTVVASQYVEVVLEFDTGMR